MWIDELQTLFGNPVVVEIKSQNAPAGMPEAEHQLRSVLTSRRARLGLLIYRSPDALQLYADPLLPLVVRLSTAKLAGALRDGSLAADIRALRNALAHGAGIK